MMGVSVDEMSDQMLNQADRQSVLVNYEKAQQRKPSAGQTTGNTTKIGEGG